MRKHKSNSFAPQRRRPPDSPEISQLPATQAPRTVISGAAGDPGLGELLNIVYRRKWLIAAIMLGSLILAGLVLQFMTPRFEAQTLLLLESQGVSIPTVDSVLSGRAADDQGVRSQVEVLRSRGLAAATIKRLALDQDPEFNSQLGSSGLLLRQGNADADKADRAGVIDAFLKRLDVEAVKNSRVLSVIFASIDPEKAALISNTLADEYLLSQMETKFEATKMANAWLNERVGELREQVSTSERAVEEFRETAGLLQTEGVTLTDQQIADLNSRLVLARTAEAEARARLGQVTSLIKSEGSVATASEVLDSALIQRLKEQQSQVERRVAELSAEYGPSHPKMLQLNAEAEDIATKIDTEVNKIVRNLSNEVSIASAREAALERELSRVKVVMASSNDKQIQLRALEREAEADRALLTTLLARYKEIGSQDESRPQQADARIISRADAPSKASFPNKKFVFGTVTLLSGLLALIAVFVLETLHRGLVSGAQIEDEIGVTSLGFVPLLDEKEARESGPGDYIMKRPRSAISQALRTVFWSLSLATPGKPNIVVIASSQPGEGKTTIALGLARTQALSGQKTLLIDADIRKPAVHTALDAPLQPGLIDMLKDGPDVPLPVNYDLVTSLDFITAGESVEDPLALLDSKAMDEFLARARKKYDLIVIDTPPVMAALDACALSRKADSTMLVVRWSETPRAAVIHSLKELARAKGHLAGALLNMVDVTKHSKYLYGDSGAYHGTLSKYYSEAE
jgi:capsular exopolysaccharide synthesis family protein